MFYKEVLLNNFNSHASDDAVLRIYLHSDNAKRPMMVVVPGGGYQFLASSEDEPVVFRFLSEGFNCASLHYAINKAFPSPHNDLLIALNYINNYKSEMNITNELYVIGFSAGGHLVGSYSYLYQELAAQINVQAIKPSGIILAYPVISLEKDTHEGTKRVITGDNQKLIKKLSINKHITSDYPKTYIIAGTKDTLLNFNNTQRMALALKKHGVNFQKRLLQDIDHGFNIFSNNSSPLSKEAMKNKMWVDEAINFLKGDK